VIIYISFMFNFSCVMNVMM